MFTSSPPKTKLYVSSAAELSDTAQSLYKSPSALKTNEQHLNRHRNRKNSIISTTRELRSYELTLIKVLTTTYTDTSILNQVIRTSANHLAVRDVFG